MQLIGLDIGASSVKLAQLAKEGSGVRLLAAVAGTTLPSGMRSDSVSDLAKVTEVIKKLVVEARLSSDQVSCSLPEGAVHVEVIVMPPMSESELSSAIVWEAEQVIPFQVSEAELSWQVIEEPQREKSNKMKVLLAAAPKRLVEKYVGVVTGAGLNPIALEPESLALARSLGKFQNNAGVIVGLGASGTTITALFNGSVVVSRSLPTGGEAITRALASYLNLEVGQAEEYKRAYGLTEDQLEGKVRQSLLPVVDVILGEIRKVVEFYQSNNEEHRVATVVLTGGGAGLPGMVPYLARGLGVEVVIGDPFGGVVRDEKMTASLVGYEPLYGVAMGLALRSPEG